MFGIVKLGFLSLMMRCVIMFLLFNIKNYIIIKVRKRPVGRIMAGSKNSMVTQADFENFKNEIKSIVLEMRSEIVSVKSIVINFEQQFNTRMNRFLWQVIIVIIGGFSIAFFFFYNKFDVMNDHYSDRLSRIEAGISLSSPEVLNLIDKIKKRL